MTITRLALVLSLATTLAWTAKALAIAAAGGLGRSPIEGPLFLLGLGLAVVAAVVTGLALSSGRRPLVRTLAVVAVVAVVSVLGTVAQLAAQALQPARPGWVWGEVNLWVVALALLVLSLLAVRRRGPLLAAPVLATA